ATDDAEGDEACKWCGRVHTSEEPYCYIQPWTPEQQATCGKEERRTKRLVWFDTETTQDTKMAIRDKVVYKHKVNVLVSHHQCVPCIDAGVPFDDYDHRPEGCVCGPGLRRRRFTSFDGRDPVADYIDFLLHRSPKQAHDIVLSHNGGKFDIPLVMERMNEQNIRYDVTMNGLKVYTLDIRQQHTRRITFKDSLNFFFTRLDKLVGTFDLQRKYGVKPKPFFPYLYNTDANVALDVPATRPRRLPPQHFYCPGQMSPEHRAEFIAWHRASKHKRFSLRKELLSYCENDVDILRLACVEFRRLFLSVAGVDPFMVASTIAKLALNVYRQERFLGRDRMLNAPEGGFRRHDRQSAIALRYMKLLERRYGWRIRTSQWSLGEAPFNDGSNRRMDGFVDARRRGRRPLAIEFLGCYYHGCQQCFPDRTVKLCGGRTAQQLHDATFERLHRLQELGYRLHIKWECDFRRELETNAELRARYRRCRVVEPLDPREDALRGGRTEAFKLHHQCRDDTEEIRYIDVVSLYPYVMKNCAFPTGKPRVLTAEEVRGLPWRRPADNPYKGMVKVRVVPPRNLRRPLLPYRTESSGRLVFPLCARCAEECNQTRKCRHSEEHRGWIAAYTHCELNKALELGYVVTDVFEAYHYEEDQWASLHNGNGLFDGYVNAFLKLKVEASGWPSDILTEEEQIAFAERYLQQEGIELDRSTVGYNEGLRFIAKLLLNSLWGKLAQRHNMLKVVYTTTPQEFWALMADDTNEVIDIAHLSEHTDRVAYRKKASFLEAPRTNNVPVALFVTSHARLHLYHFMEQVPKGCLLYCDTDSLIYVKRADDAGVQEGDALGEMSREYPKRRIVEFICGGPKNYGLRHVDRVTGADERFVLKVRGFTLNYNARKRITFDTMKALIFKHFHFAKR
ncbi:hypothetical protein AAVH_20196, partial [Aphelenchoides avenae]